MLDDADDDDDDDHDEARIVMMREIGNHVKVLASPSSWRGPLGFKHQHFRIRFIFVHVYIWAAGGGPPPPPPKKKQYVPPFY